MIPLRYVSIDLRDIPLHSGRGTVMALDRAVVLSQLLPDELYYPNEIAHILLAHEVKSPGKKRFKVPLNAVRHTYMNLAYRCCETTNPCLSGAAWLAMLGPNLHRVAALMKDLKKEMEAAPGVVFALDGSVLKPYPDQDVRLDWFYLTNDRRVALQIEQEAASASRTVIEMQSEAAAADAAAADAAAADAAAADATVADASTADAMPDAVPADAAPAPVFGARRHPFLTRWRALVLVAIVCLVPSVFAWYWLNLDEISLVDIQEMGAPLNEPAYFMAQNRRYEVGDRVRFEGEVGIIREIQRKHLTVGERTYPAPRLYFFGQPMRVIGNLVVYPGSPRRVAGNFQIISITALDDLQPGYLSWLGGYKEVSYACLESTEAMAFWERVMATPIAVSGQRDLAVPEDIQLATFLAECNLEGAVVKRDQSMIEVIWP